MRRRKKKGPVQAKKISYDGISFASGLERYTYIALKKNKLYEGYESETFQIIESFQFPNISYEKQANSKGEYVNRGSKKILGMHWGTVVLSLEPIMEPGKRFKNSSIQYGYQKDDAIIFKIGQLEKIENMLK